ncbi:transcription factor 25 isoform X1 [Hippopotamus amphibius kiboko]|uniref:transcription factor 25 isoform X1 n=1 Tax=Hippopotamus amphibius kiboko TaxID=575201 RepID=UPI00259957BF|nr:transcription factor 25 isoform X1 [Hippopotamus amphibius kiboko]
MSRRALRRLRGEQRGQEPLGPGALQFVLHDDDDVEEEGPKRGPGGRRPRGAGKEGVRVNNRFELINIEDLEEAPGVNGERPDGLLVDAVVSGNQRRAQSGRSACKKDGAVLLPPEQSNASGKLRKKKRKQKNKKNAAGETSENGLEDIDRILERIEDGSGSSRPGPPPLSAKKHVLYVEHRHLNPDTELKRYFGARAVLGEQRPRQRQRVYPKCTWLTTPKSTWPRYTKPGLSMRLLESRKGGSVFAFEHSEEYQQAQHRFLAAVESMEPNNIVVLLQTSPYHVDSLLQLSDACRFQEDQEMARDLVERALYSMECAFHPLFSLTSGTCRLDYRRPENRSFYLALYKQMSFLEKRGCPRTALEYCKLILSLEPEEDPLCMLLLVDHLALRARSYEYLVRLFQEWEAHRNLSQLPNFAFSVPLAYFLLSQQADLPDQELSCAREKASLLIQQALLMFPGALRPLLEHCGVRPDAAVAAHRFFGPDAEISQPPALSQLVSLYLGRSHFLWKEPATMSWLEENVREVLQAVDAGDPAVEACESRRKVLYQRAPRNIHRHVVLSEIEEAVAALPPAQPRQPRKHHRPLLPFVVAKLHRGGGAAGGRRGRGSAPRPGLEQADAGRARHDGQLPLPRPGGATRGPPRGRRGVGLRRGRGPGAVRSRSGFCAGRVSQARPRSAAVLSACLCSSINVNGVRSARRQLFFPGAAVGAPRSAQPPGLPESVPCGHSRPSPSPSPGRDLPAAALPAWGTAECVCACGGQAEKCSRSSSWEL